MRLYWKLFICIFLVFAVVAIFLSIFYSFQIKEKFEREFKYRGIALSQTVAYNSKEWLLTGDVKNLENLSEVMLTFQDIVYISFYSEQGAILFQKWVNVDLLPFEKRGFRREVIADSFPKVFYEKSKGGVSLLDIWVIVVKEGYKIGAVRLGFSLNELRREIQKTYFLAFGICLVLVLLIGVLIFVIIKNIFINALVKVSKGIEEISKGEGDLTRRIGRVSNDEIGDLATFFDKFVENLRVLVSEILSVSRDVAGSAESLSAAAEEMNASVEEVSSTIQENSKGIGIVSQKISDITKEVGRLNSLTKQIDSQMKLALVSSRKTSDSALTGRKATSEIVKHMNEIYISEMSSVEKVRSLAERSKKIKRVMEFILNISDQTDLLALNAAIEAARVGEIGRGFSVLADEIRKLAVESAQASSEVGSLIQEVLDGISDTEIAIDEGAQKVSSGKERVDKLDKEFEEILNAVTVTSTMIQEIAHASKGQSVATDEVSKSIAEISQTSLQNAANLEEVAAATQEETASMEELSSLAQNLANLSSRLQEMVSKFKIE